MVDIRVPFLNSNIIIRGYIYMHSSTGCTSPSAHFVRRIVNGWWKKISAFPARSSFLVRYGLVGMSLCCVLLSTATAMGCLLSGLRLPCGEDPHMGSLASSRGRMVWWSTMLRLPAVWTYAARILPSDRFNSIPHGPGLVGHLRGA